MLGYFILTANASISLVDQLSFVAGFFVKNNPQNYLSATNIGRVFSIAEAKPVFNAINSIDRIVASTASHSMLTSFHSLEGFTNYEVVFSVLSKEYSYVSV